MANNIHYDDACNCKECRQKTGAQREDRPVKMLGEPLTAQNSEMMCSEDLRSVNNAEAGSTCDNDVDLTSLQNDLLSEDEQIIEPCSQPPLLHDPAKISPLNGKLSTGTITESERAPMTTQASILPFVNR